MALISFKKKFAGLVESGIKRQTIRQERKRPFIKGETLYLYTGLRTKACRKLGEAVCKNVTEIIIFNNGFVLVPFGAVQNQYISKKVLNAMAVADGFKNWEEFKDFFQTNYSLPFNGLLIEW